MICLPRLHTTLLYNPVYMAVKLHLKTHGQLAPGLVQTLGLLNFPSTICKHPGTYCIMSELSH